LDTSENPSQNVGHSSTKLSTLDSNARMTYGKNQIGWRRSRVLELSSEGYTQREIASKLQIAIGTVANDVIFLRKQAQQNIQRHIHESIPEEYEKAMLGTKRNLRHAIEIRESSSDLKIRLEAIRIANECYKFIMELSTNSIVISNAIDFVNRKQEQIEEIKMLDKRIEAIEEERTTEGVF